jgi:CBS domain containing-hemolysin-like protein
VLDVLLPSFDAITRVMRPLTYGLLRLGTSSRRRNMSGVRTDAHVQVPPPVEVTVAVQAGDAASEAVMQEGQARELLRNLADFRETMVREVMTPRPDIIGIGYDATLDELLHLFRDQQYSRIPVFRKPSTTSRVLSSSRT